MHGQRTSLHIALCVIVMAAVGVAALVWWKMSLITIALLAFGLVCLVAGIYTWMTGWRIGRLLDKRHPVDADDSGIITETESDRR